MKNIFVYPLFRRYFLSKFLFCFSEFDEGMLKCILDHHAEPTPQEGFVGTIECHDFFVVAVQKARERRGGDLNTTPKEVFLMELLSAYENCSAFMRQYKNMTIFKRVHEDTVHDGTRIDKNLFSVRTLNSVTDPVELRELGELNKARTARAEVVAKVIRGIKKGRGGHKPIGILTRASDLVTLTDRGVERFKGVVKMFRTASSSVAGWP